jgi:hypothetical protein
VTESSNTVTRKWSLVILSHLLRYWSRDFTSYVEPSRSSQIYSQEISSLFRARNISLSHWITTSYPEPDKPTLHARNLFFYIYFNIIFPSSCRFPKRSLVTKFPYKMFLFPRAQIVLHDPPILSCSTLSTEYQSLAQHPI